MEYVSFLASNQERFTSMIPLGVDYTKVIDINLLRNIKSGFSDAMIGQDLAQKQIIAALYNVAKHRYNKPCVILLYGSTGIGKTESAKFIAAILGEKLFRKQFSMLHSEEFSSYIFGGKHNQNSLAKELLERASNIILFDEFDKPHPVFHSAFYQLFDGCICFLPQEKKLCKQTL